MSPKRRGSRSPDGARQQRGWFWGSTLCKVFADSVFPWSLATAPAEAIASQALDVALSPGHISTQQDSSIPDVDNPEAQVFSSSPCYHSTASDLGENSITDDDLTQTDVGQARSPLTPTLHHGPVGMDDIGQQQLQNISTISLRSTARTRRHTLTVPAPAVQDSRDVQDALANHSKSVQTIFQKTYECAFTESQFIGLCAYMCSLLRLGYPISTSEIDGFIRMYPKFAVELAQLEETQVEQASTELIAYHQWYLEHKHEVMLIESVVTEQKLRGMWSENPYVFLKAQYSLDVVAKEQRRLNA